MKSSLKSLAIAAISIALVGIAFAQDLAESMLFLKDGTPLPSIRGMYCAPSPNCPSAGRELTEAEVKQVRDRRHLGELATLVLYDQNCKPNLLPKSAMIPILQEWNAAAADSRNRAIKHEMAAMDRTDIRKKYGEEFGGWSWFCPMMSRGISKGDYADLIGSAR
jgi:hypothetical protein